MPAKARTKVRPAASRGAARTPAPLAGDGRMSFAGGALILLVLALYARTLTCGYIWDDDYYVEKNTTLHSLDGLRQIWLERGAVPQYYPLVHTTFWVEYHLWGLWPAGYHLTNALLHAAAVLLLWRLLARLGVPGAWLAAAVFAVHPVEVESVAWITERKNVLSAVFALASLFAYLRFAPPDAKKLNDSPPGSAPTPPATPLVTSQWHLYVVSLALYVAALLSKTVTASVPAVLLVIYWWKRGRITWRDVAPLVPFFVIGLALASITVDMERNFVGAKGGAFDELGLVGRCLVAGRALWFYAAKLAWPAHLNFFYARWNIDPHDARQYAYPLAVVAAIVGLWLARSRIGRGPLAAVLIFAGVLVPALGFVNVYPFRYSFVADHFQYHASTALIALGAAAATLLFRRVEARPSFLSAAAAGLVLAALALISFERIGIYVDQRTLFEDVVSRDAQSCIGNGNLGTLLLNEGKLPEALAHLTTAVKSNPKSVEAYLSLAAALSKTGDCRRAVAWLERALTDTDAPRNMIALVHNNLASILSTCADSAQRDADRAVAHAEEAVRLDPGVGAFYNTLGVAQYRAGQPEQAIRSLEKSIALQEGGDSTDRFVRGMAAWQLGRQDEARQWYAAGVAWREEHEPTNVETQQFQDEAAALMAIPK